MFHLHHTVGNSGNKQFKPFRNYYRRKFGGLLQKKNLLYFSMVYLFIYRNFMYILPVKTSVQIFKRVSRFGSGILFALFSEQLDSLQLQFLTFPFLDGHILLVNWLLFLWLHIREIVVPRIMRPLFGYRLFGT